MLITQIQAHSPQNTQTYMKTAEEEKKEMFICAKKFAKLRPHQMTGASQRASRVVARSARIQIINLPCILTFFFLDDFILFETCLLQNRAVFLPPRRCF